MPQGEVPHGEFSQDPTWAAALSVLESPGRRLADCPPYGAVAHCSTM